MNSFESALVVMAPEAEPIVKSFRDRFDPVAALGMPAHITVLYPFIPPDGVDRRVLKQLAQLFATHRRFEYTLAEASLFPDVLYLHPEPADPFRALTRDVHAHFPEFPPYRGAYSDIVPHLTLAQAAGANDLESIAAEFSATTGMLLPVRAEAAEIALVDNSTGRWRVTRTFALATS